MASDTRQATRNLLLSLTGSHSSDTLQARSFLEYPYEIVCLVERAPFRIAHLREDASLAGDLDKSLSIWELDEDSLLKRSAGRFQLRAPCVSSKRATATSISAIRRSSSGGQTDRTPRDFSWNRRIVGRKNLAPAAFGNEHELIVVPVPCACLIRNARPHDIPSDSMPIPKL